MGDYWFSYGTPSYLARLVSRGDLPFRDIAPTTTPKNLLESAGIFSADPIPELYYSGYLTINDFDNELKEYSLDCPNEEVKTGFRDFLRHLDSRNN